MGDLLHCDLYWQILVCRTCRCGIRPTPLHLTRHLKSNPHNLKQSTTLAPYLAYQAASVLRPEPSLYEFLASLTQPVQAVELIEPVLHGWYCSQCSHLTAGARRRHPSRIGQHCGEEHWLPAALQRFFPASKSQLFRITPACEAIRHHPPATPSTTSQAGEPPSPPCLLSEPASPRSTPGPGEARLDQVNALLTRLSIIPRADTPHLKPTAPGLLYLDEHPNAGFDETDEATLPWSPTNNDQDILYSRPSTSDRPDQSSNMRPQGHVTASPRNVNSPNSAHRYSSTFSLTVEEVEVGEADESANENTDKNTVKNTNTNIRSGTRAGTANAGGRQDSEEDATLLPEADGEYVPLGEGEEDNEDHEVLPEEEGDEILATEAETIAREQAEAAELVTPESDRSHGRPHPSCSWPTHLTCSYS